MQRMRSLTIVSTMFAALIALALPASAAIATTGPRTALAAVASQAAGGRNDYFNSDSCTSSTFCMAVGAYDLNGHVPGLSAKLSRGRWVEESVPSPNVGINIFANEVSCASPSSCLFVGSHWAGSNGPSRNLAEAWNGSSWRIVAAAGPAGSGNSGLDDVACPTTTFCLAVGFARINGTTRDTAYTWTNGTSWQEIGVPAPRGAGFVKSSELAGLACSSSSSCMAVGNYVIRDRTFGFAARWNNGGWKLAATPAVRGQRYTLFQGISCPAANRCVAVGDTVDDTRLGYYHAFAEVWNGGAWKLSMLRRQVSVFLGVSCPGSTRCVAAGYTFPRLTSYSRPLLEAWNGRTWAAQHSAPTPAPDTGNLFEHVSCVTRSSCEAVGYRFHPYVANSTRTVAERWNGRRWTVQTTPNP